jgi:hypothetical protein
MVPRQKARRSHWPFDLHLPAQSLSVGRAFQFDRVSFRVTDVNRRAVPFGTVIVLRVSDFDSESGEVSANLFDVEWIDLQAEMIHIAPFILRRRAALLSEQAFDRNQIDERLARPQMHQAEIISAFIDGAPERVAIKANHPFKVARANDNVIESFNMNHPSPLKYNGEFLS